MNDEQHHVAYGDSTIEYTLRYADRKTLGIDVHPDLRVTVTAPPGTPLETIQARVKKRADWILRQQRELSLTLPHMPPRRYVSGEAHRYLGRQYRLKVVETEPERVKMTRGLLLVHTTARNDRARVEELVKRWYRRQARRVIRERIKVLLPRFANLGIGEPEVVIKEMTSRWGSCTEAGTINLNLKLMQVPKEYIDYVIVHEMCHLIEYNHSKRFYLLLDQVMPDWRTRRKQLNQCEVS